MKSVKSIHSSYCDIVSWEQIAKLSSQFITKELKIELEGVYPFNLENAVSSYVIRNSKGRVLNVTSEEQKVLNRWEQYLYKNI